MQPRQCVGRHQRSRQEFNDDGPGNSVLINDSLGGAWYNLFPGLTLEDSTAMQGLQATTCVSWWPNSPLQVKCQAKSKFRSSKTLAFRR